MEAAVTILLAAVLLDACLGEYPRLLHPVVWLGTLVALSLRLAPQAGWWRQFAFGTLLGLSSVALCGALAFIVMRFAQAIPWLEIAVGTFLLKASFALKALGQAAQRVMRPLQANDLGAAREALRALCSRDPSTLGSADLLAGTVQSLAENASDSVIAPLFYYLLLGVPGAVAYRAINTLDAMVGYRGRFEALGKFSARLDDLANWLPARLTALLLLLAGGLSGMPIAAAWRVYRRDAAKTPSPNGGRPMAMMAGLLGVCLEKKGAYLLGDPRQPLTVATARQAWRLVVGAALAMIALCAGLLLALNNFWPASVIQAPDRYI
jgi:adenosylcobinamide-phosphate synthase